MLREHGRLNPALVVGYLALFAALVFSASLGAVSASAQSSSAGGKTKLHVGTKTVKKFITRRARVVGLNQMPMFPNARIYKTGASASCRATTKGRRWVCAWFASVYEESRRDPGEFEVRQSTIRFCQAAETRDNIGVVWVKRARSSRRLRVTSPWSVTCDLTEEAIDQWNVFAYGQEWQPLRAEPLEVPQSALPLPMPREQELPPAPTGQPGGPPPGPLSIGAEARAARTLRARAAATTGGTGYLWRGGSWLGCSPWDRWSENPQYHVFYCYWRPPSAATLPGAALGIFSQDVVTYWEAYYWAGNDNYGRPVGKLFAQGQY